MHVVQRMGLVATDANDRPKQQIAILKAAPKWDSRFEKVKV